MTPEIDPVQLGQTLGAVLVVGGTCVAAIRRGMARWRRADDECQRKEKRALRAAVRSELSKHLAGVVARIEAFERALEECRRPASAASDGRTRLTKKTAPRPAPAGKVRRR